jgi:hypothetical protein
MVNMSPISSLNKQNDKQNDKQKYDNKRFNIFIKLLLSRLGVDDSIENITNKINISLDDKIKNEIMMNISSEMINKLIIADDAFKNISNNEIIKSTYIKDWEALLYKIAKLQGLIILKKVKKVIIDPSIANKNILIGELIKAFDDKLQIVNKILLDDLNLPDKVTTV